MKTLFSALAGAQSQLKAALKDSTNPHFKSRYADLESVIEAMRVPFAANGLAFMQSVSDDSQFLKTIIVHESGENFTTQVPLIITKNDMQGVGSAITYARRYGLAAACGISQTDDDAESCVERPKTLNHPYAKEMSKNPFDVPKAVLPASKPAPVATPKTDKISAELAKELGTPEVITRPVFERTNPRAVSAVKEALSKAKIPNELIKENKASFEEYLQIGRDFVDYDQAVFNFFQFKGAK
jgi:hypothetical protein